MLLSALTSIALGLVGLGILGAHYGVASPTAGFLASVSGLALLIVVLLLALPRVLRDRRERPWFSFLFGIAGAGALAGLGYLYFSHPLPEITTDTRNVPKLRNAGPVTVDRGSEYLNPSSLVEREYDPTLAPRQGERYPALTAPVITAPPEQLYAAFVRSSPKWPGWRLVVVDAEKLHAEAEVEDTIFRFVDDVAIDFRRQGDGTQTRVEVRSRRRDGLPDFGGGLRVIEAVRLRLPAAAAEEVQLGEARLKAEAADKNAAQKAKEEEWKRLRPQPVPEEVDIRTRIRQAPPPVSGPQNRPAPGAGAGTETGAD